MGDIQKLCKMEDTRKEFKIENELNILNESNPKIQNRRQRKNSKCMNTNSNDNPKKDYLQNIKM